MPQSRARSASPIRGAIRRRKTPVARQYCGYSAQEACLATWCAIASSQRGGGLATIGSPGVARRPENGRSRAEEATEIVVQWLSACRVAGDCARADRSEERRVGKE